MIKIQLMEKLNYFLFGGICFKYRYLCDNIYSDELLFLPFKVKFGAGILNGMKSFD